MNLAQMMFALGLLLTAYLLIGLTLAGAVLRVLDLLEDRRYPGDEIGAILGARSTARVLLIGAFAWPVAVARLSTEAKR
jgi:uncharacterized membrane protein HdeD (DUF308 family)